jgi:hypothetical protein
MNAKRVHDGSVEFYKITRGSPPEQGERGRILALIRKLGVNESFAFPSEQAPTIRSYTAKAYVGEEKKFRVLRDPEHVGVHRIYRAQ